MNLPLGFTTVTYFLESGVYPERKDVARAEGVIFSINEGFPTLPLLASGLFNLIEGSTAWAIDADKTIWMSRVGSAEVQRGSKRDF